MKKALLVISILITANQIYSQNGVKNFSGGFYFDAPVLFTNGNTGINAGVGFWFGENSKTGSIGIFLGSTAFYNKASNTNTSTPTATIAYEIKTNSGLLVMPSLSVWENYVDPNLRIGYAMTKEKTIYIHSFISEKMGAGLGIVVKLKY